MCNICLGKNIDMYNMINNLQYNSIKNSGKINFTYPYYDSMKSEEVRFICKICVEYICETRNIN